VASDATGPIDPDAILRKPFTSVKRGYDPLEVQTFLMSLAGELRGARDRERELERALADSQRQLREISEPSPSRLTAMLGEETARVLDAANSAAAEIRTKAEESVAQLLREAQDDVARRRTEAEALFERKTAEATAAADDIRRQVDGLLDKARADAEHEVEAGRQRGREMIAEAQQVRERMLRDLARRRKLMRQQIEQLQAGRARLLEAYDVVRTHLDQVTDELAVSLPEAKLAAEAAGLRVGDDIGDEAIDRELAELAAEVEDEEQSVDDGEPQDAPSDAAPADQSDTSGPVIDVDVDDAASLELDELVDDHPEGAGSSAEGPKAPNPTEGRKSSAVTIIRSGQATTPVESDEPAEADASEQPASRPGQPSKRSKSAKGSKAKVAGLFARIKEEAADDTQPPAVMSGATPEATGPPEPEREPVTELEQRDAATADIERKLARRLKRELSEEQNELLDAVRRQKGTPTADAALPTIDEHARRFAAAAQPELVDAVDAGARFVESSVAAGAAETQAEKLAGALADGIVKPLRERLTRCFSETASEPDDLAERLRACYREWKTQRVDQAAAHGVVGAFNLGVLAGLDDGTKVHWVVDDGDTPSPDCADNALAGNVVKGEAFPTGHVAPPIHPSCRCLVVPARS
jgi:cell division septum initiation protein DivIVA